MTFTEPNESDAWWHALAIEARAALRRGEQLDHLQFLALERLKPQNRRYYADPEPRWERKRRTS